MKYHSVYILGEGSTPFHCAQLLHRLGVNCIFWENILSEKSFVKKNIISMGIKYLKFDRKKIGELINEKEKILILSVNNTYIFPPSIIQKDNINIINYHNSLLPHHKGVHAEAWAIYNNDNETGVTWHIVDEGIDSGNIITQQKIILTENVTSLSLLREQSNLAVAALNACLSDILLGKANGYPQDKIQRAEMHLKRDIPNDGELNLNWENDKIWNFLRAMDYGCLNTLGQPTVCYNGKKYSWMSYGRRADGMKQHGDERGRNIIINDCFVLKNIFEILC